MAIISGPAKVRTLNIRPDYQAEIAMIPVEEYAASNVITKIENGERVRSWLIPHKLLKRCYNIPGIPNGSKALITITGDVVIDPLKQLDDSWSKENIRKKLAEYAKEQEHKADKKKSSQATNVTMILLSSAVVILVLGMAAIGLLNYYGS